METLKQFKFYKRGLGLKLLYRFKEEVVVNDGYVLLLNSFAQFGVYFSKICLRTI
jgi:glucose-6-phosphate isomerase